MDVLGDGNCFLYAAMGINGRGADHPQAAADLRRRGVAHSRSLPETVQDFLDLMRATVDPADPYGNNGTTWYQCHTRKETLTGLTTATCSTAWPPSYAPS
jgi:hypothetical protein